MGSDVYYLGSAYCALTSAKPSARCQSHSVDRTGTGPILFAMPVAALDTAQSLDDNVNAT